MGVYVNKSDGINILLIIVCEEEWMNVIKKCMEIGIEFEVNFKLKIL